MKFFAVLATFVALVAAAPTLEDQPLEARDQDLAARQERCVVKSTPDWSMVEVGYKRCIDHGCDAREMLALMETGTVESNWQNLDCGDKDSQGIYQQRNNGAWGSYADIRNPRTSTDNFLRVMLRCSKDMPGRNAGDVAQCAQRSEKPRAYQEAEGRARAYLAEANKRWGGYGRGNYNPGGGASNVGSNPGSSSGGSSSGSCAASVKAVKGDTCAKIAGRGKVSVATLKSLNSNINGSCNNIKIGTSYCTKRGAAPAPVKNNNGGGGGCKTVKAVKGDSCSKVAGRGKISLSRFLALNKNAVNSKCTNLQVGRSYCVN